MAGPRICRSPRRNSPSSRKDELARGSPGALTKDSNIPTPFPAISQAQTPTFTPAPAPAPLNSTYTNVDLQKAVKLALELFIQSQAYAQGLASTGQNKALDRSLKVKKLDLYYRGLHTECYYFC